MSAGIGQGATAGIADQYGMPGANGIEAEKENTPHNQING
jgi:hypothetical protein